MKKNRILIVMVLVALCMIIPYYIVSGSNQQGHKTADPSEAQQEVPDSNQEKISSTLKRQALEWLKAIALLSKQQRMPAVLPKSMTEVKLTPELKKAIDDTWPTGDGYEFLDYVLRLYDKLAVCLGDDQPQSGEVIFHMLFTIDRDTKVAVGHDGTGLSEVDQREAFFVRSSTLTGDHDREMVDSCIREAHEGQLFDIEKALVKEWVLEGKTTFYIPLKVRFPLEEADEYWFLSHNGQWRQP